ncbi:MAG: hypothetical protein JRN25_00035 [Nitrososphaerota archaeon]|jgi:hypothetical protein|nr:hypothetical protein [Nitrososphaerota archaeon]MDG6899668.1 hypothetical protein [Nitrososphaerota archaeon]MDG6911468.1 hypothetical protein [Nitrososphaerota archaeon]MDG6920669.1 hypothetical protein [Nitrososphaerota archaeon]MDG6938269.1 hypothetical protein [Nitrososphaerota archaeon]
MKLFRRGKAAAKTEPTTAAQDSLSILCQGDEELHYAMSYLVYLKPEEQIALIGATELQVQNAAEAIERGDRTTAIVDYETAARIELYRGNKENVRMYLEKARGLQDGDGRERLSTLLSNLEKVMAIAKRYYHRGDAPSPTDGGTSEQMVAVTS